jgi:mycothiol synthase
VRGLLPDPDHPRRAEHALTAVRRDWRRRGVATVLKRSTLAWAAGHGFTEVYTWTQRGNDGMRALNTRLGFITRSECITMRATLPLPDLTGPQARQARRRRERRRRWTRPRRWPARR